MDYHRRGCKRVGDKLATKTTTFHIAILNVCISTLILQWTAHKHGQEELPLAQCQGQRSRVATPRLRSVATAERSYTTSEMRGGSREHQEGTAAESSRLGQHRSGPEELPHARGQGQRPGGATPRPRSSSCLGTGGPRGATPRSRSGGAALRSYP